VAALGRQELKKASVLLTIFLMFITAGIYCQAWVLTRRKASNRLQSKDKLDSGVFVFVIAVFSISILLASSLVRVKGSAK
jgi:hypothetical protein